MRSKMTVSSTFIGRHERDFFRDGFIDEVLQRVESQFL